MTQIVPTLSLNLPKAKVKGLIKLFGGDAFPFFWTDQVVKEGTPMKVVTSGTDYFKMQKAGPTEGALVVGLAMQVTYDESALTGQLAQLANYHFANDTAQKLQNFVPIGLLSGNGMALLRHFEGTAVAGTQCYVGGSGSLCSTALGVSGGKVPAWFETGGVGSITDPSASAEVTIRYSFGIATP